MENKMNIGNLKSSDIPTDLKIGAHTGGCAHAQEKHGKKIRALSSG